MTFSLANANDIIDIWSRVFDVLGLNHFSVFQSDLGFDIEISIEVRQCCRHFTYAYQQHLGFPVPPASDIQVEMFEEGSHVLFELWKSLFSDFERLNVAEAIYDWGSQVSDNFIHKHVDQSLSRDEWAYGVLLGWARKPMHEDFAAFKISKEKARAMNEIVRRPFWLIQDYRYIVKHYEEDNELDAWDEFAFQTLKIGSWIKNEVRFAADRRMWQQLYQLLSPEELEMLQNAAYTFYNRRNKTKPLIPIHEFRW
jgi:hypothetical protein